MATRLFSDEQLEQLRSFPDIGTDELIRYFTLTPARCGVRRSGPGRGPVDRLGHGRSAVHVAVARVRA